MTDFHLNWKSHIDLVARRVKRSIVILSRIRLFTNITILINLYYTLICPFLTYGLIAWSNAYHSTINPIFILQKKALRILTFSGYKDHSNPLFIKHNIIKFHNFVFYHNTIFVYNFKAGDQLKLFNNFFESVRLASKVSLSLPRIRINYGKFNIRFVGVKAWNLLNEKIIPGYLKLRMN